MRNSILLNTTVAGLLAAALASAAQAQQNTSIFDLAASEEQQTSKDFEPAPTRIETSFGALEFAGGG